VFVVASSIALAWGIKQHVVSSPRFAVKTIRIDGAVRRSPEQISEAAGLRVGMNVFSVDLEAARNRLLLDPWVATAQVERQLPATLTITLTEREAAAVVAVDADLYLCTPEGELFKKLEADDPIGLIVITGLTSSLVANDRKLAVSRVRSALELMAQYASRGPVQQHPIQEIGIADDGSLRMVVGRSAITLEMGRSPYPRKVLQAARVIQEVQKKQKGDPAIVFLDNEAHPERVVVRMR
jgi:cell division protein FtsQ